MRAQRKALINMEVLFSHREGHIVRPPTYNPNNTLGIKLPRLANTFFCLSIPPRNSRGQSPRLSVSSNL